MAKTSETLPAVRANDDVDLADAGQVDVVPLPDVREALLTGLRPDDADPDVVAELIAQRLLNSVSVDEAMSFGSDTDTAKMIEVPVLLRGVIFMPSDVEDSKVPVYAIMDVVDERGKAHVWTCGGRGVVTQLLILREHGALPRAVKIVEVGRQKGTRNRPLYLQDVKES